MSVPTTGKVGAEFRQCSTVGVLLVAQHEADGRLLAVFRDKDSDVSPLPPDRRRALPPPPSPHHYRRTAAAALPPPPVSGARRHHYIRLTPRPGRARVGSASAAEQSRVNAGVALANWFTRYSRREGTEACVTRQAAALFVNPTIPSRTPPMFR